MQFFHKYCFVMSFLILPAMLSGAADSSFAFVIANSKYLSGLQKQALAKNKPGFTQAALVAATRHALTKLDGALAIDKSLEVSDDATIKNCLEKAMFLLKLFLEKDPALSSILAKIPYKKIKKPNEISAMQLFKLSCALGFPREFSRCIADIFVDRFSCGFIENINEKAWADDLKLVATLLGDSDPVGVSKCNVVIPPQIRKTLLQQKIPTFKIVFNTLGVVAIIPYNDDSMAMIWNWRCEKCYKCFIGEPGVSLDDITISPDGKVLIAISKEAATAWVYDIEHNEPKGCIRFGNLVPECAVFDPQSSVFAVVLNNGSISVFDIMSLKRHPGYLEGKSLSFSPDGEKILVTKFDGIVCLEGLTSLSCIKLTGAISNGFDAEFSSDGNKVLVPTSKNNTAMIVDLVTHEQKMLKGHSKRILCGAFSPKGTCVVTASEDRSLRIWDGSSGEQQQMFSGFGHSIKGFTFSDDEKYLATIFGSTIFVFDLATGKKVYELALDKEYGEPFMPHLSEDGKRLTALWGSGNAWRFLEWELNPLVSPAEGLVYAAYKKWAKASGCSNPQVAYSNKDAYIPQIIGLLNWHFDEDFLPIPVKSTKKTWYEPW